MHLELAKRQLFGIHEDLLCHPPSFYLGSFLITDTPLTPSKCQEHGQQVQMYGLLGSTFQGAVMEVTLGA